MVCIYFEKSLNMRHMKQDSLKTYVHFFFAEEAFVAIDDAVEMFANNIVQGMCWNAFHPCFFPLQNAQIICLLITGRMNDRGNYGT